MGDVVFEASGKEEGLEIWRIEASSIGLSSDTTELQFSW